MLNTIFAAGGELEALDSLNGYPDLPMPLWSVCVQAGLVVAIIWLWFVLNERRELKLQRAMDSETIAEQRQLIEQLRQRVAVLEHRVDKPE